jgi:NAD(P)-dependent dehydrogenase (short-subunit alcohol dehydrogenase family)
MDLTEKVVAITGGARGIGRSTAEAFLARGAKVAIGDVDAELSAKAAAELGAAPGARVAGLAVDVRDTDSFATFLDAVEAGYGPLDVLVNNAGIMPTGPFLDETQQTTDRLIDVNVHGVLNGSRLAGRRFAARGAGHIVNVASVAGIHAEAQAATYCGTKHFVVGFTESLYRELRAHGVGVTCVLPGVINTELSAGTKVPRWAKRIAIAEPKDVAAGVVTAVEKDRVKVVVPASLGALVKSISWLPLKTRFGLLHAVRFDELIGGADPHLRAVYHRRLAEQATR